MMELRVEWMCCYSIVYIIMTHLPVSIGTVPTFTITSYPLTLSFSEGTATPGGTTLHTFHVEDNETGVVPFITFTYDPTSGSDMVYITETNTGAERTAAVILKDYEEFDYETTDTYKIYATANDGTYYSDPQLLTIQIIDVGEAPYMQPNTASQSFTIEENAAGTVIGSPSFTIEDQDSIEVHTWSLTGGNGTDFVSINTNNGTITLKVDYDRENALYAEHIYVDVNITDKYGLSATTTYYISITDRNDNIPVCSPSSYEFNITSSTSVGTLLTTFTCTDADISSPNNEITYSLQSSDQSSDYFSINGTDVELAYTIDLVYGEGPWIVYLLATDGGTTRYTGTATISYTIPEATTLVATTTDIPNPSYDALSSDTSLTVLLIAAAFIAAFILGYILVLCWRWHTFGRCLPNQCPDSHACMHCCTCCPDDDIEKEAMVVDSRMSSGFAEKKGMSLGIEAPSSRRKFTSVTRY